MDESVKSKEDYGFNVDDLMRYGLGRTTTTTTTTEEGATRGVEIEGRRRIRRRVGH